MIEDAADKSIRLVYRETPAGERVIRRGAKNAYLGIPVSGVMENIHYTVV